jgi:hypothetical protein
MHMSDHENQPSTGIEIAMLRSDMDELFQTHADKVEVYQPDDFTQPAEIVLAGTCHFSDAEGVQQHCDMQIRQRFDKSGNNYLIVTGQPGDYYWGQMTDKEARSILLGNQPMSEEDAAAVRWLIRPELTQWSEQDTRRWASQERLYDMADSYARKKA